MVTFKYSRFRFYGELLFLILLLGTAITESYAYPAESSALQEHKIKAAYLYKLPHFIEWPSGTFPNENSPFVICVIGKHDLTNILDSYNGKVLKKRAIKIRQITNIEEMGACHVLFISMSEKLRVAEIIALAERIPILTISDLPEFSRVGGMITLINLDDKVRFDINMKAVRQRGLTISSQLLQLAHDVTE